MRTRWKTLHITNSFHASSGGVATSYRALLAEANKQRRQMRLVVPSDRNAVEGIGKFGRIYYVAAPRSKVFDTSYRLLLPSRYLITRSGPIWDVLREEQPDLLEVRDKLCLNWIGGLFRRGWHRGVKRPVLVGSTSERMDDLLSAYVVSGRSAKAFARCYMRYCYIPLFDAHIANSSYTADEVSLSMIAKHARPVFVCTEGVDSQSFHPEKRDENLRAKLVEKSGGSKDSLLLLYSGRISPEKNVQLIADTMERLSSHSDRDYRLIIAGAGPLARWLEQRLSRSASGRFLFVGHISNKEELAHLYASCDIFVHPNPREPFGIAPLEAMASGLALVAPSSGGLLSYANAANSWLVSPHPGQFAAAILEASDSERRTTRSRLGRATAEQFDWSVAAPKFFAAYDELIESQHKSTVIAKSGPGFSYDKSNAL